MIDFVRQLKCTYVLNHVMIDHRLRNYEIELLSDQKQVLVLAAGWKGYHKVLSLCYHNACKSRFDAKKPGFEWGVYIDWAGSSYDELDSLLKMMTNVVCIEDQMQLSFALGYHSHFSFEGKGRTQVGEKVFRAKPYNKQSTPSQRKAANELADWFVSFFERHPAYKQTDYIVPVPSHKGKEFDLPTYLVERICTKLKIKNGVSYISKTPTSESQKDLKTIQERQKNIRGAFSVSTNAPFSDQAVTIIDDIYDSGTTIHELAKELKNAGAIVQGLTATRVNRGYHHAIP